MKKVISNVFLAGMLVFGTSVMFTSCKKPCKDVVCENEGTEREDGDDCVCDCTTGYEGELCQTEMRTKFNGTYTATGPVTCGTTGNWQFNSTLAVSNSSGDVNKLVLTLAGINLSAEVTGSTSIKIPSQQVSGFTYTGSGTISGNNLDLTIEEYDPSIPETCTYDLAAIKQ